MRVLRGVRGPLSGQRHFVRSENRGDHQYDVSRRNLLAVGGFAALGAVTLRSDSSKRETNPFLVRPPGGREEPDFLSRCVPVAANA